MGNPWKPWPNWEVAGHNEKMVSPSLFELFSCHRWSMSAFRSYTWLVFTLDMAMTMNCRSWRTGTKPMLPVCSKQEAVPFHKDVREADTPSSNGRRTG
jgi:hypothetical protein